MSRRRSAEIEYVRTSLSRLSALWVHHEDRKARMPQLGGKQIGRKHRLPASCHAEYPSVVRFSRSAFSRSSKVPYCQRKADAVATIYLAEIDDLIHMASEKLEQKFIGHAYDRRASCR